MILIVVGKLYESGNPDAVTYTRRDAKAWLKQHHFTKCKEEWNKDLYEKVASYTWDTELCQTWFWARMDEITLFEPEPS